MAGVPYFGTQGHRQDTVAMQQALNRIALALNQIALALEKLVELHTRSGPGPLLADEDEEETQ
jgi:hypothetical protein